MKRSSPTAKSSYEHERDGYRAQSMARKIGLYAGAGAGIFAASAALALGVAKVGAPVGKGIAHAIKNAEPKPVPAASSRGYVLNGAVVLPAGTQVKIGPGPYSPDQSGWQDGTGEISSTEIIVRPVLTQNQTELVIPLIDIKNSTINETDEEANQEVAYVPLDGRTVLAPPSGDPATLPVTLSSTTYGGTVVTPRTAAVEAFSHSKDPGAIDTAVQPFPQESLPEFEHRVGAAYSYPVR